MATERTLELRQLASKARLVVDNGPGLNRRGRRRYKRLMKGKYQSLLPPKELLEPGNQDLYKVNDDGTLKKL